MSCFKYRLGLIILVTVFSGCGTPLTKEGNGVMVYEGASVSLVSSCQRLGVLHESPNASTFETNLYKDMVDKLRNDAARMGGDSVAITSQYVNAETGEIMGVVYNCNNRAGAKSK